MTSYEKSLRLGTWAIVCALVLRLGSEGVFGKAVSFLKSEEVRSFVIYLETGRRVRSLPASERFDYPPESAPAETVPEETTEPPATQPTKEALVFGPADTVSLYNTSGLEADTAALLEKDISFPDLTGPKVLIYSTHTTESYTKREEDYEESAPYRTLDGRYNMLSLGTLLEGELENRGIEVLRDETLHDYPSYNAAYSHARKAVTQYLKDNPSLALVIDLHRDAGETAGGQLRPLANVADTPAAQLMVVVGTDARGLVHPNWQENLSLGLKLQALLERLSPGITRPTCLRPQRFNQDLSPGCLLIEVGGAGNTRAEAMASAPILGEAIAELLGD